MHPVTKTLAALALLLPCTWLPRIDAAKCPEASVVLTGTKQQPYGHTYTETLAMYQTRSAGGHDGQWRVHSLTQVMTYPFAINPPVSTSGRVDMKNGVWMNCTATTVGNVITSVCRDGNVTFDVVSGRIGSSRTGVWIGRFEGDRVTLKFHDVNPLEPTITGTVQRTPGGRLELAIRSPGDGGRVVFSAANPGVLELELTADVTPAERADSVTWEVPAIAGSTREITPASRTGRTIRVRYTGLPGSNAEFGEKTVRASVDAGMCKAEAAAPVKVFYPRDASNNPQGTAPNWFHYWSQTSARVGPARYGALAGKCAQGGSGDTRDGLIGYYRYTVRDDKYYICDLGRLPGDFRFRIVRVQSLTPFRMGEPAMVTGIDTFATASRHENEHYQHFKSWWFQFNPNPIHPSGGHMMAAYDRDEDFIPDTVEPTKGLDPAYKSTLSKYDPAVTVDDEELLCWLAEAEWTIGSADREDWAKPGKQWR